MAAGVDIVHIPYRERLAVAMVGAGGHCIASLADERESHVKSGRLRALLVTGSSRSEMRQCAERSRSRAARVERVSVRLVIPSGGRVTRAEAEFRFRPGAEFEGCARATERRRSDSGTSTSAEFQQKFERITKSGAKWQEHQSKPE